LVVNGYAAGVKTKPPPQLSVAAAVKTAFEEFFMASEFFRRS
jgi:hypothetical protein